MRLPAGGRGTTTVAPRAVRRIAERAAAEALPDGGAVLRGSAAVRGTSARIAVGVRLPYPVRADEAARRIRERAESRTAALTGLSVPRAEVRIDALSVRPAPAAREPADAESPSPGGAGQAAAYGAEHAARDGGRGGRIRAQRRVPAALVATVAAAACALLLVDVVAVRLGSAPAAWRTSVAGWAAAHGPADAVVRVGGVFVALTGAWLLGCALLPGSRRRLRMAAPAPRVRAALDRTAAARVVRDRADAVPGVARARVRVRRRRVRVLAGVGFGTPQDVRAELIRVVAASLPELGLARTPALRVRVRREAHWRPPEASEAAEASETAKASESAEAAEASAKVLEAPAAGREPA